MWAGEFILSANFLTLMKHRAQKICMKARSCQGRLMSDKRKRPRLQTEVSLSLNGELSAVTADISSGGLCAALPTRVIPGYRLKGALLFSGREVPFVGEVAWARAAAEGCFLGLRFVEPPADWPR
jgi:hypothetical protein